MEHLSKNRQAVGS